MFEVKGLPILVDEIEVLKELKRQVYEKQNREILKKIKRSGDNIMICCPNHNEGQERNPSCGITTVKKDDKPAGTLHCFACGYVDTLQGMIGKCFGYDDSYGERWLLENFVVGEQYERPLIPLTFQRENKVNRIEYVTEEELSRYRFYHPYMFQRKLTYEIIEKYDVGYQKDFQFEYEVEGTKKYFPPQEVITFPVKDINGNCLFVSRRSIHGKTFFLPKNIDKPIYGLYELPKDCKEVIICESVFNALTCVAYGKPAIALFGTGDKLQCEILNKLPIRKYILALDPDEAGEKGVKRLKYNIKGKILTKLIVPKGKDINDLSYDEFKNLQEIFI